MENEKNLEIDEKIRLFNGKGNWNTFDANGKVASIMMSDGPHGLRKQVGQEYADLNSSKLATCFPTACSVASSWNRDSAALVGKSIGLEAKKEEIQLVLGPGINIKRSPLCGRNFEYFSEDPFLAGSMAAAYINAMQSEGVGTSLKHYAANNQEKRRQTSNSIIDERTLHEIYLRAFEIAVKNAAPVSIMSSYNRVNGCYVGKSEYLLNGVLRKRWGFEGFVVSDWGACLDAAACMKAGMDLAMPDSFGYFDENLKKALADKILEEKTLDVAWNRIVSAAEKLCNKKSSDATDVNSNCYLVDYEKQHKAALKVALDSGVLLKNENFLPLQKGRVVVIGELAEFMKFQGGGSSHITCGEYPNALASLENNGLEVVYSKGYFSGFCPSKKTAAKNNPLKKAAVELLVEELKKNPEVPVLYFCGLTEKYEGEGFDRENLDLPLEQISLLEEILNHTKNVGLVTFSGAPISIPFENSVRSILHMYLCGEACGEACGELICGKANPSGKLAETFPLSVSDIPCKDNFGGEDDNVEYREGVFTGYRYYSSKNKGVQFEFGFGLSYTAFEYSDLKVLREKGDSSEKVTVQVKITNSGDFDGAEVVEVYVKNPENALRPDKELRGFEKVFLKKGESKTVEIVLDDHSFKVYSSDLLGFETAGGIYEIQVCSSLSQIELFETIEIEGKSFDELVKPVEESYWESKKVEKHSKGTFTLEDSLVDMSKSSLFVKILMNILILAIQIMNKGKSKEDPAVKIAISAICENPLESLISTSGGAINAGFARFIVKMAN